MKIKYHVCFDDDYFKNKKILFLIKVTVRNNNVDYESLCLRQGKNPSWKITYNVFFESKNIFKINDIVFYKLLNLSRYQRNKINKHDNKIDLFKDWGLLKDVCENLL